MKKAILLPKELKNSKVLREAIELRGHHLDFLFCPRATNKDVVDNLCKPSLAKNKGKIIFYEIVGYNEIELGDKEKSGIKMINKKKLIERARNVPSSEYFGQEEYNISEEFRMSKLIDFVLEEYKVMENETS